ncbi:MAG: HEAT repeat domain-containing protein [Chloroflexi bacterium]|nr:HEAT repeat domain-containing protein [Chloroflexota bacterium]
MSGASVDYEPARFQRMLIQDAADLPHVVAELGRRDALGVDLEMVQRVERRPGGYQEWVQVLALIQIASDPATEGRGYSVVIDPLRCRDLSPLRPLMAGRPRKVFLGGGQDAALLERATIPARNVADVGEVALAIFGRREDGMAALARRIFGLNLDKTVRRTDWLARPLNPVLLAYAHRDAELTLMIYRWFQQTYPEVLALHERLELDPIPPPDTPRWLRDATVRSQVDPLAVLMEHGLDPVRDQDRLAGDVRGALRQSSAPRQINRLLRVAGDLGLAALVPDILPMADSPSSLIRAAAARAIGQLATPEEGTPVLERLKQDPLEDVRKAADAGLRDLRTPRVVTQDEDEDDSPSLGDSALSALQRLMKELQDESG